MSTILRRLGEVTALDRSAPALEFEGVWSTSGDLARLDGDGFLWIAGRADAVERRPGVVLDEAAVRDLIAGERAAS